MQSLCLLLIMSLGCYLSLLLKHHENRKARIVLRPEEAGRGGVQRVQN